MAVLEWLGATASDFLDTPRFSIRRLIIVFILGLLGYVAVYCYLDLERNLYEMCSAVVDLTKRCDGGHHHDGRAERKAEPTCSRRVRGLWIGKELGNDFDKT